MSDDRADLIALIEPLARMFFGEPNRALSSKGELRFGSNGSKSIKLETGEWYDHELKEGGGALALIRREVRVQTDAECFAWLESKGLWSNGRARSNGKQHAGTTAKRVVVDRYEYEDANGAVAFAVERFEYQNCDGSFVIGETGKRKKTFWQKRPDPDRAGGWLYNVDGVPAIPYRLPELMEAVAAEHPVLIVEGERKVDLLRSWGMAATCCSEGANKWRPEHAEYLHGADVVILPDNDDPGRAHRDTVGTTLQDVAASVRVLELPGLGDKEDIVDWAARGGTVEQLHELIEAAGDFVGVNEQRDEHTGNGRDHNSNALPFILFDQIELVPKQWLAKDFLGAGETSCWYGHPGDGKSVLIEDFGLHVAAGMPWHSREVKQGAVLYIALERMQLVKRRALAFKLKHNVTGLPFAIMGGVLDFRDQKTAFAVLQVVAELERVTGQTIALIIVDTISRALCGGDENSPKDMGALVNVIGRLQAGTGAHVALVHHVPHEHDRLRGHGLLLGAIDTTVHIVKGAESRSGTIIKDNDGADGQAVHFTLESIELVADGDNVTTAPVVIQTDAQSSAKQVKLPDASKLALRALHEVLAEIGTIPPASNHIPANTRTCSMSDWRSGCRTRVLLTDSPNQDTWNKQFVRSADRLQVLGLTGVWNDQVWVTGHAGHARTNAKMSGDKPTGQTRTPPYRGVRDVRMSGSAEESDVGFEVLGAASPGARCIMCGKGGAGVMRIRLKGGVDEMHEGCAQSYVAALNDPPVKVPDEPADEGG